MEPDESATTETELIPDGQPDSFTAGAGAETEVVKMQCGSQLRNKPGKFCRQPCMKGRTRCRLHGGASPQGADSKSFKHGMYSKVLPKSLKSDFDKLMTDPGLLDGKAEVSLMQIRLAQLSARLGTNESIETWRTLQSLMEQFQDANAAADANAQVAALTSMNALILGAVNDDRAWAELHEFVEGATKIAEREWKRVVANRTVATADQVRAIVQSLIEAVSANVSDPGERRKIALHINQLRILPSLPVGQ